MEWGNVMEMPKLEDSIRKITQCEEGQELRALEILTSAEKSHILSDWHLATKRANVRLEISEVAKQLFYFAEQFDSRANDSSLTKERDLALWVLNLGLQIASNINLDQLMQRAIELAQMEGETK